MLLENWDWGVCKKKLTGSYIINQVYILDILEKIYSCILGEEKELELILAQLIKINSIHSL